MVGVMRAKSSVYFPKYLSTVYKGKGLGNARRSIQFTDKSAIYGRKFGQFCQSPQRFVAGFHVTQKHYINTHATHPCYCVFFRVCIIFFVFVLLRLGQYIYKVCVGTLFMGGSSVCVYGNFHPSNKWQSRQ